jgi:polysaccharide pyruvyl transferase WcaK-like protein
MEYWGWRESSESGAIHGTYQDSLCRFCTWLLEKGYRVLLLSGDDMDDRAIRSLKSLIEVRLSNPSLVCNVLAERAHGLADVMTQMAGADVIIATRYHNVVCALKMGKPTLSLSYAEKNAALLEDAGLGGYVDYVEAFDVERLKNRFEQLVAERSALAKGIAVFSALTRKRLQHQEERLRARFHGAPPQIVRVADGGAVGSAAPHADAGQKGPLKEAPATGRRSP